jgi:hypothetical protein
VEPRPLKQNNAVEAEPDAPVGLIDERIANSPTRTSGSIFSAERAGAELCVLRVPTVWFVVGGRLEQINQNYSRKKSTESAKLTRRALLFLRLLRLFAARIWL